MKKFIFVAALLLFTSLAFAGCAKGGQENNSFFEPNSEINRLFEVTDIGEQYLEFGDKTMRCFEVKNVSNKIYNWVNLDLVFVNNNNEVIHEHVAGTYSQFAPKETIKVIQEPKDVKDVAKCYVKKVTEIVYED